LADGRETGVVTMCASSPSIAIFGASGLIGQSMAEDLQKCGFAVRPVARRFTKAQRAAFGTMAIETPFADLDAKGLAALVLELDADIIVNCVGVLQDGPDGRAEDVHRGFVSRLVTAIAASSQPILLVHFSIPGQIEDDRTNFSRTKREAEQVIAKSGSPFLILRPGFVIAPSAYGGSALVRALAALPLELPARESARPFAVTASGDLAAAIAHVALRWRQGQTDWSASWDVMERQPSEVSDVIDAFKRRFGGPRPAITLPGWLLAIGATSADLAGRLGWASPMRSAALEEMQRGVAGDPQPWITATGIEPASLQSALAALPSTIQERWFGRLYLAKALVIGVLAAFWMASGAIALTAGFPAATMILTSHGLGEGPARWLVATTSLLDVAIGACISVRRTCRRGLIAGCAVSLTYLAGATLLAPALWADPLGPLVKIFPQLALTIVALAILDDR
jgi:uncharacterized protein YbjT (DUF2867 family)